MSDDQAKLLWGSAVGAFFLGRWVRAWWCDRKARIERGEDWRRLHARGLTSKRFTEWEGEKP